MGADFDADEYASFDASDNDYKRSNEIDTAVIVGINAIDDVVDEWIRFVLKYGNLSMLNMVLECWNATGHSTEMQVYRILKLKKDTNNTWLITELVRTIVLTNRFHQTSWGSSVFDYAERKKSTVKFSLLSFISSTINSVNATKIIKLLDESPFSYCKEEIKAVINQSSKLDIKFNAGHTFLSCWLTYRDLLPTSDHCDYSTKRQEIVMQLANSDNLFLVFDNRIRGSESVTDTINEWWKDLEGTKNFGKRQVHEALVTIYFAGNPEHFRNQYGFIQYGGNAIVSHCKQVEKELCILNQRDLQGLVTHYV